MQGEKDATDGVEDLWGDYYQSVFNPARIKIGAMKREMPVRFWEKLPETKHIPSMLQQAPQRVSDMLQAQPPSARRFVPDTQDINSLKQAAQSCQACELCLTATKTVFGEGNPRADILVVVSSQEMKRIDLVGHL